MKLSSCLLFSFIMLSLAANAQEADSVDYHRETIIENSIQVVTGFTMGRYSRFVEVGVAKSHYKLMGHSGGSTNIFASVEMKIDDVVSGKTEEKFMIGPKIGAWAAGGCSAMAMGANMIYYTDFTHSTLVFRPEIGFGFTHVKVVYGYNFSLTKRMGMVDRSVGSVVIGIGVKKLNRTVIN